MATTRYTSEAQNSPLSRIEFVNNSFGREDAILYANPNTQGGTLQDLPEKLKKRGMTAYADVRDGQQVLVVYGFKKQNHEQLLGALRQDNLITDVSAPQTEQSAGEKASGFKKLVKRYAIQMAAVSGLMGHACMAAISGLTKDWQFFGTAWKYTLADAVISVYGTDKSVTADPIMQDFKNHLWEQGQDTSFIKARADKISAGEGFDKFMRKNAFSIANAAGALGNLNQIGIGRQNNDIGFIVAGATSFTGALLQIFGSEKKTNPEQLKRHGPVSRVIAFANTNPMQVAAAANFTDPFALFYSAFNSKKNDKANLLRNNNKIAEHYAKLGASSISTSGLFDKSTKKDLDALNETATKLNAEYKKKDKFILIRAFTPFDKAKAEELQNELEEKLSALKGKDRVDANGKITPGSHEAYQGEDIEQAAKSIKEIKELENKNDIIDRGGKWKPYLLGLVALFYTIAPVLRFIAKKTATAEENKDAFNEVYSAAAESLLNIEDPQKREEMTMQMGHYLSTHEKMKEPVDVIVTKIRERVNSFAHNPFVGHTVSAPEMIADTPALEQDNTPPAPSIDSVATIPAPQTETTPEITAGAAPVNVTPPLAASTEHPAQIRNWAERDGLQPLGSHEEQIDAKRVKQEAEIATGVPTSF